MHMLAGLHFIISPSSCSCSHMVLPRTNPPHSPLPDNDYIKTTKKTRRSSNNSSQLLLPDHRTRSLITRAQKRPDNNVNDEDPDEIFDELFDKYGKVVYTTNDQKSPSAEVDDDAESLSFAVALAKVASEVDAIGSRIRDLAEKQYKRVATGDYKPNSWTLLDFGDVVVHIFLPPQRAHYNLEEFYANATLIELPFENQSQFRR